MMVIFFLIIVVVILVYLGPTYKTYLIFSSNYNFLQGLIFMAHIFGPPTNTDHL
jgi:hypothetical protein